MAPPPKSRDERLLPPIAELSECWVGVRCLDRRNRSAYLLLTLMAARRGGRLQLQRILERLRCQRIDCPQRFYSLRPRAPSASSTTALKATALKLEERLAGYGILGRVDGLTPGPVVTMYEFQPSAGTKLSKIRSLVPEPRRIEAGGH
jgi:hypothetical protein